SLWIKDVYVKTFYRNKSIVVEVTLRNDNSKNLQVTVLNHVFEGNNEVLELPPKQVTVEAGKEVKIVSWAKWDNPKLWAPWSPNLYNLTTTLLVDEKKVDEKATRFGFREFWVENGSYYLNGIKIVLRMASTHLLGYDKQTVVETYRLLKNLSINSMRLHAQPWPRIWYDLADEMGIMIVHESAVWCLGRCYRVEDPVFWKNFAEHLKGQILLHRNHPSIVIWSIENELLLTGGWQTPETEENLAKLVKIVKTLDPTRPVMFEGDFDPKGVADIINLHYPHEFPKHDQYPNTAYWLENITLLDSFPRIAWKWNKSKPLHIGEFLWVSFTSYDTPAVFFGDIVYTNPTYYYVRAKALAWKFQIQAYRVMRVNGFCPWNIFGGQYVNELRNVVAETYKPITFFLLNYDNTFYEETTIRREFAVVNDHYRRVELELECTLLFNNTPIKHSTKKLTLPPAEVAIVYLNLTLPKVSKWMEKAVLQVKLLNGSKIIDNKNFTLNIYKKEIKCSKSWTIYLLGEDTDTEEALKELGANIVKGVVPEEGLVVIAKNSLNSIEWAKLIEFVEKGGKVIVLEQDEFPNNPLRIKLSDHYSTITLPITLEHEIFVNLTMEDFRFWYGDHVVSYKDLMVPALGPTFSLVSSGAGLKYSQLLEVRLGKGILVFSQLALISKFEEEPRARLLLARLIDYYSSYKQYTAKTGIYYRSIQLANVLELLGVEYDNATISNLDGFDIVLAEASDVSDEDIEYLREFCRKGGVLYLYNVDENSIIKLEKLTGINFSFVKGYPPVVFTEDPIVKLLGNNLLYWVKNEKMWRHGPYYLDSSLTEKIIVEEKAPTNLTKVSLAEFKVVKGGKLIVVKENLISMYGNGYVSTIIHVREPSYYMISIEAHGTPVREVYPIMEIWLNRSRVWSVEVSKQTYYNYIIYLEKGNYTLTIAFINDEWIPGKEDRNLYIHSVAFGKLDELTIEVLTQPSILIKVPVGEGYIIVDQVPWLQVISSMNKLNYFKALKYPILLLSSLGVPFKSPVLLLQPEDFTIEKGVGDVSAWRVALYSNGNATAVLSVVENATYKIIFVARGNKAKGEYPIALVY
ncbi:MAG TPA: hypothetical protein ENF87_02505, partial [Thermoproteales archaeon]|nr:hypothetical protein [Thermoproteales archaeon]